MPMTVYLMKLLALTMPAAMRFAPLYAIAESRVLVLTPDVPQHR